MRKIMVTGAFGQIGSELVPALRKKYGNENVVAIGHKSKPSEKLMEGPCDSVEVTDKKAFEGKIKEHGIDTLYHLVSILSASGEKNPGLAWNVNMNGLYNALEIGRELPLERIIMPSSIAAFGPETPRDNTPNETIQRPTTMYGVTKVAGELLGNYYFKKFGLDVRGLRFPGIISSEALPGGGTTDYAVEIYYEALKKKSYTCFLKPDTYLPMMYMPDALKAIMDLAQAPISKLKHHCDFNVNAMSFSPKEQAESIKKHIPEFMIDYKPDFRQAIADSWPKSLDDSTARREWGWKPKYDLASMTKDMLEKLAEKIK
ncbi:MAG: NAD-dependent epimerase/dehydratase family protein [Candidatus Diapherotrites archaeon]|nr:NAD-dependent epimerase/dehydratase family protein [Candidatus Diapherotrites archaeon]